ncbi:hypothetical protein [Natrinema soli]|uniref:Uncharacterized protein n=1 Tax=Natrinema soli TaxID=1930624 RepID=A0ABD5SXN6_9EURY|nr:hypothetical protein [Natrinema soli]
MPLEPISNPVTRGRARTAPAGPNSHGGHRARPGADCDRDQDRFATALTRWERGVDFVSYGHHVLDGDGTTILEGNAVVLIDELPPAAARERDAGATGSSN